ncbi:TenA family transcriptional regulator [Pseudidiomarina andamanensis]|uniref:Iron-containing redox enzyme family protein n=1 Tax=Pseudidiomarina andamanensis TaxID=1940690 RepID=A0AA92ESG4_9GAMM|nr:iron-containing redox enzyme family protein [Pseudidiomarina andamanensis]MDS0218615.1 iron-containing redox enzyme family protein [Pseudidiomarina andamanensis]QGT95480.1 iron-containing redox enzyme family protein [Pseudidiomarina andamanensis]
MTFFNELCKSTEAEQQYLLSAPIIAEALAGRITLAQYQAFLTQAFHHVKHTTPLLMRAGSRISHQHEWMRRAIIEYINEEYGHERWILNDLKATGLSPKLIEQSEPHTSTAAMVALVYHHIDDIHPASFFGMAHVLEGTSVKLATQAAGKIQAQLNLPNSAFSYLLSHGDLDQEHVAFFETLMNKVTEAAAQDAIITTAKHVYRLYGDMFRAIPSLASEQPSMNVELAS